MVAPIKLREITKSHALKIAHQMGRVPLQRLAAVLSEFNHWRILTNKRIVREMAETGKLQISDDEIVSVE